MDIKGKFLKVWKVEENNGYVKLNLGDSVKNKDGTYDNWTWFDCALFGEAAKKAFFKGDLVEVTSGIIYQEKYNEKWYTRIKIFHIHHIDQSGNRLEETAAAAPTAAESPFKKEEKKEEPKKWGQFTPSKPGEQSAGHKPFEDDVPF